MFAASPIFDENGDVIAGFFLSFNPMVHFSAITEMAHLGDTGESYVFDKNAILISKTRYYKGRASDESFTNTPPSKPSIRIADPGRLLAKNESSPTTEDTSLPLTFMAENAIAKNNGMNIEGYSNYRGEKVFGAWRWIDSLGVGIAVEVSEEEGMQFYNLIQAVVIGVIFTCSILVLIMLRVIHYVQMFTQLKLKNANTKLENRVNERTRALTQAQDKLLTLNKELETLAITDGLTLLPNRRFFDQQLEKEWQRCLRDSKSIAIILFDIDHFKLYNDHYGHVAGDACLKQIGDMLNTQTFAKRPSDVIARYGGEEFVVLLSNATQEYTKQVAENICKHVEELNIAHEKTSLREKVVTVSVGSCITSQLGNITPSQLIEFADQALYQAKNNGRNNSIEVIFNENKETVKV